MNWLLWFLLFCYAILAIVAIVCSAIDIRQLSPGFRRFACKQPGFWIYHALMCLYVCPFSFWFHMPAMYGRKSFGADIEDQGDRLWKHYMSPIYAAHERLTRKE